jgi:type I restriction-modification system DNA methylase subunit
MSKDDELRDILDQTAKDISRLYSNPRTWLSWMVYLLDRLEQRATDAHPEHEEAYKEMLSALQDEIRNRLRTGGW